MKPLGVLLFPIYFAFVKWPRIADRVAFEVKQVRDLPGRVMDLEGMVGGIIERELRKERGDA